MCITKDDVIPDANKQKSATEELSLGFGKCSLQIRISEDSSIKTMEELASKQVVTSFEVLTGDFCDKLDDELKLSGNTKKIEIEYIGGSELKLLV